MTFLHAHVVASSGSGPGQDRVAIVAGDGTLTIAVADGAGTTGGRAADQVVAGVEREAGRAFDPAPFLAELDSELRASGAQTTAVILRVSDAGVAGASVGDSEAWVVGDAGVVSLTENQQRKPLLGSGAARPVPIHTLPLSGTLVVATDGLFKYAPRARLLDIVRSTDLSALPSLLVELVRLRSGTLQDDVAVVVCRRGV